MEKLGELNKKPGMNSLFLGDLLCNLFPGMNIEQAIEFLHMQMAAAIGLYSMTQLPTVDKVIQEHPELDVLKIDFKEYYERAVVHFHGFVPGVEKSVICIKCNVIGTA